MDDFENLLNRVGNNIRRLRKLNELTQVELAEKTNRPQSSIARIESATSGDATISLIYDMCNTLGVSLSDIFATAEGKNMKPSKIKLNTKWERVRAKVDELSETDRTWIADIILIVLANPRPK